MKERVNQLFREKFILVMLVLGLLTIVAAAGAVTIRRNGAEKTSPYLDMDEPGGRIADGGKTAGNSDAEQGGQASALADAGSSDGGSGSADAAASGGDRLGGQAVNQDTAVAELAQGAFGGRMEAAGEQASVSEAGAEADGSLVLDFTGEDRLSWPVSGNVILGYSMDTTTWFPTLEQYKCSPANLIQSEVSTPVVAPANARVAALGTNEEIGAYLELDLGNGFTAVCGQLKEIPVVENEYLHKGDVIGYVAEPTKYYSVEGSNLYFELRYDGEPVDALDYLE